MSKLSFRARALDATKSMPIFRKNEVSDLPDYSVLNRAVPQMPTGMEKEEESEHHLQRAISAQQVYGDKKVMVIPVPEAEVGVDYYNSIYKRSFRVPKQYIHNQAQALNSIMEQERPDYDMDSDDEKWLKDTNKRTGLEITEIQFEEMLDRLEKSCGNQVVTLQEAKLLLKEDDDLIKAVYDYWLQKRLKDQGALSFQVRQERRDGSSSGDSYVAFRRRTEKMQTRKNRKNDEASYEKMLKLRRDLSRAVTILEMIKRREKSKRELLHLTLEIVEKRYQMKDWDSKNLKLAKREAESANLINSKSARNKLHMGKSSKGSMMSTLALKFKTAKIELDRKNGISPKKKRISKKLRHEKISVRAPSNKNISLASTHPSTVTTALKNSNSSLSSTKVSDAMLKASMSTKAFTPVPVSAGTSTTSPNSVSSLTYQQAYKAMCHYEFTSSEDERPKSPLSGSVAPEDERKKNPDGLYAFRRKPGCKYNAPLSTLASDQWPWMDESIDRYSLTTLSVPERCVGFCRRRMGRGGRMLLDRKASKWDKQLAEIDLNPEANYLPHKPDLEQLMEEIKCGRWKRYRPYNPATPKIQKLLRNEDRSGDSLLKSFGHSSVTLPTIQSSPIVADSNQTSSDSETVDIMTTDESSRRDLHKRLLLGSPHVTSFHHSSTQRTKSSPQKRASSWRKSHMDKDKVMFAVSALAPPSSIKSTGSSPSSKSKHENSQKQAAVKVNSTIPVSPATSRSAPFNMTLISGSPNRYAASGMTVSIAESNSLKPKAKQSRFTVDQARLYGVKSQDVQAAFMSVGNLHPNSSTANSMTFSMSTSKAKCVTTSAGLNQCGVVSLSLAQPVTTSKTVEGNTASQPVRQANLPMTVMATLRIGNPVSSSNLSGALFASNNCIGQPLYTVNNRTPHSDSMNTVFIAPSARLQYTKAESSDQTQSSVSVPVTLTPVNSSSLAVAQLKPNPQGLVLSQQSLSPNLNLAITPASPQKHQSQLSIPHTSGHAQAVLIATPAGAGLSSNLPSHCASSDTEPDSGGNGGNQSKTVSINVARVQGASSNLGGQIYTLQQNPDLNLPSVTLSGSQPTPSSQNSSSTWVTSGTGPNILKLGGTSGFQIHPVKGGNKSLTVISKRMRNTQNAAARNISIAHSKQTQSLNSKTSIASSHITLVPDNRSSKGLISVNHPSKNNATVVLAAKNLTTLEPSCLVAGGDDQTNPQINIPNDNPVVNNPGHGSNKANKNKQPMEVT